MNPGDQLLNSDAVESFIYTCDLNAAQGANGLLHESELVAGINNILNPMVSQITNQVMGMVVVPPSPITELELRQFVANGIYGISLENIPHCAAVFIIGSWFAHIAYSVSTARNRPDLAMQLFNRYIEVFNEAGQRNALPPLVLDNPNVLSPYISSLAIDTMIAAADDDDSRALDAGELVNFLVNVFIIYISNLFHIISFALSRQSNSYKVLLSLLPQQVFCFVASYVV